MPSYCTLVVGTLTSTNQGSRRRPKATLDSKARLISRVIHTGQLVLRRQTVEHRMPASRQVKTVAARVLEPPSSQVTRWLCGRGSWPSPVHSLTTLAPAPRQCRERWRIAVDPDNAHATPADQRQRPRPAAGWRCCSSYSRALPAFLPHPAKPLLSGTDVADAGLQHVLPASNHPPHADRPGHQAPAPAAPSRSS